MRRVVNLGIESPTLKRQVFKRVALKYLCDARQDIKNRIAEEIDASRIEDRNWILNGQEPAHGGGGNIWKNQWMCRRIVQQAIDEYMRQDSARREPAYKTELQEERRRREQLEKRMNELVEENKRSRALRRSAAERQYPHGTAEARRDESGPGL